MAFLECKWDSAMTKSNNVKLHIDEYDVATVTLNRGHKHNAFDEIMISELTAAFNEAVNRSARIMLLEAVGKSFSAGADLAWMQRMVNYSYEENLKDARLLALMLKTLNELPIPTIAKIDGGVFGGAVGLVCCCDMAIGSEKSLFCLSEVKVGLIPATISPYVIDVMGQRASRRYFQTAEVINADKSLALGLLSERVDASELNQKTQSLVKQLLQNSPAAVKAAKELVFFRSKHDVDDDYIEETSTRIAKIRTSKEGQEGLLAFIEKRKPQWIKSESSK